MPRPEECLGWKVKIEAPHRRRQVSAGPGLLRHRAIMHRLRVTAAHRDMDLLPQLCRSLRVMDHRVRVMDLRRDFTVSADSGRAVYHPAFRGYRRDEDVNSDQGDRNCVFWSWKMKPICSVC
jgi:hypothetical protein